MLLFKSLENAILRHSDRKAFYIGDTYYTYQELAKKIAAIRNALRTHPDTASTTNPTGSTNPIVPNNNVGLITNDDLATYAAIIAIWLEGKAYVPLSPQTPEDRNHHMIRQATISTFLDSSEQPLFPQHATIQTNRLPPAPVNLSPIPVSGEELAYILFTSGTTGTPKGVPITRNNLSAFVDSFSLLGLDLDANDKWLQMFELTFDLSIFSYLVPLLKGACVYTIPKNQIRYSYIYKLLDEHQLTVALMIPGLLHYLRPYFDEINCTSLKYNLFCGEALPADLTEEWSRCIPHSIILNVYGPSEATIFCTHYLFHRQTNKTQNGIISIGKPMEGTVAIITDSDNHPVPQGQTGELCLSGPQLTRGYLQDKTRNTTSFFHIGSEERKERFYKTGDLCFIDPEGDILYIGRIDSQVKIQGYRVELPEVEFHAQSYLPDRNVIALAFPNSLKNLEIGLCIEGEEFDTTALIHQMRARIPSYMIPTRIRFLTTFPQNTNGKIDRQELSKRLQH